MSKRYIFFIGTLCNGGAERVVSILASKMAELGLEVEILTYYFRERSYEVHPDVMVTSVETLAGTTNKLKNIVFLRKYFQKHAKVVLSFLAPFNMIAIIAKLGTGIPIIVADRNDPRKIPANFCVRKIRDILYVYAEKVVLQTENNKKYFNHRVQDKASVIYNPVDLKKYTGLALKSEKEKMIVSAGRLMEQKNQKMLIRAFALIKKKFPEYCLVIYGEGSYRAELEQLIDKMELQDKVFLPGSINDLHARMKSAEIFVLSSDYEGMPNALIEAMCMGLPVISTKVSGAVDLIHDGENGLLIETGAEAELVEALERLLSDADLRERLAGEAVKVSEKLLPDKIVKQWIEALDETRRISYDRKN